MTILGMIRSICAREGLGNDSLTYIGSQKIPAAMTGNRHFFFNVMDESHPKYKSTLIFEF